MTALRRTFIAYVRVSTLKQGVQGSSLQEQRAAIEGYAQRNGLTIGSWFEERETAAKRGRSVFARALKVLERGEVAGIIVHKIDRSARNLRDWADLGDLIDRGVEVHFAHDALDLRSRGGRLSADIQAVVAADFIRNLREETRKGFYGRLRQGLYPLRAPVGYLDRGRGKTKEIDPIYGPLVRQAFQLYAGGEYPFHRLREELHRRGLRGKTGNLISLNGLTTLLNNPFYIGLMRVEKTGEVFEGAHTPLITKRLFDRVQLVLSGKRIGKVRSHDFQFRRLVRCTGCGRSLIGELKKERYVYYRCHTRGCVGACINERVIDAAIQAVLVSLQLGERDLKDIRDVAAKTLGNDGNERAQREAALRLSVAKCEERITRLTDAMIEGLIDKETFDLRKTEALKDKRGYRDEIEQLVSQPSFAEQALKNVELANMAHVSYEIGTVQEKREILDSLMSNFYGSGKYPAFRLRSPFREYLQHRDLFDCDLRRDEPRTFGEKVFEIFLDAERNNAMCANNQSAMEDKLAA